MGIDVSLQYLFKFEYRASLDHSLTEHEIDHVFIGYTDETPKINPREVHQYQYISMEDLKRDVQRHPEKYTEWFKIILKEYLQYLSGSKKEDRSCK